MRAEPAVPVALLFAFLFGSACPQLPSDRPVAHAPSRSTPSTAATSAPPPSGSSPDVPVVAPPTVSTSPEGCVYEGVSFPDGQAFTHRGVLRCACWHGRVDCVPARSPSCFYRGRWLSQQTTIPDDDGCNTLRCIGGALTSTLQECDTVAAAVSFPWGSAKVTSSSTRNLDAMIAVLRRFPDSNADLVGIAHPGEPDGPSLARTRVLSVRAALIGRGIPASRLAATSRVPLPPTDEGPLVVMRLRRD